MNREVKRSVLVHRDLRLLAAASFVSVLGDTAALIALTLRLHSGGSGGWLIALLLFAGSAPMVLLSPYAGAVADRVDSRVAIAASASAQAVCATALVFAHGIALTLVLVALLTAAGTLVGPATGALLPHAVPTESLVSAGAVLQTAFVLGNLAGPAVGGLLTGAWGSRAPLALDAVSFLAIAIAILFVHARRRPEPTTVAASRGISGLRLIASSRLLRTVIGSMTLLVLVSASVNVAEVFLVKDALHASDAVFGVISACWMAGMVAGSALTPRLGRTTAPLLVAMVAGQIVVALGLVAAGFAQLWPAAAAAFVVGGIGNGVLSVACRTILVLEVPDALRGRVFGVMTGAINAASVVAFGAGGALVSLVGPRPTMVGCGLAAVAVGGAFAVSLRRHGASGQSVDTCRHGSGSVPHRLADRRRRQPVRPR